MTHAHAVATVSYTKDEGSGYVYSFSENHGSVSWAINLNSLNTEFGQTFQFTNIDKINYPGLAQKPIDDFLIQQFYILQENQKRIHFRFTAFLKN